MARIKKSPATTHPASDGLQNRKNANHGMNETDTKHWSYSKDVLPLMQLLITKRSRLMLLRITKGKRLIYNWPRI